MAWTPEDTPPASWSPSAPGEASWSPSAAPAAAWSPEAPAATAWTPSGVPAVDWDTDCFVDCAKAATITGLWTFDRDPDAPFAVTPGSAYVPNLDADKLDGFHKTDLDAIYAALYMPLTGGTFAGNVLWDGTYQAQFGDSDTHIAQGADGHLDLTADASVDINGVLDLEATTATVGQITQAGTRVFHTYGADSLYLGNTAGNFTETGSSSGGCIGIGKEALVARTTGYYDVAVGPYAFGKLTTSNRCTAFGALAGFSLTASSNYNTFLGYAAGYSAASTCANNTFVGALAGYSMVTNNGCVCIGLGAGYFETAANKLFIDNTTRTNEADARVKALMYGVFAAATADQSLSINGVLNVREDSVMIGTAKWTFNASTESISSKAAGHMDYDAATQHHFDTGDVLMDGKLGLPTTTATAGIIEINGARYFHAFGGPTNLFIGDQSGNFTMTVANSLHNVGVGRLTLSGLTTGSINVAIGRETMRFTTTGFANTACGHYALRNNTTGYYHVAIGDYALSGMGAGAYGTIAVGHAAGQASNANFGVFLGFAAGYYETGASKLFIDNATRANEADGRVKALIYGVFAAATADQSVTINGALNVRETSLMIGTARWQFNDAGTYIYSAADSYLDLVADGAIRFNSISLMTSTNPLRFNDSGTYWYSPSDGVLSGITDGTITVGATGTNQTIFSAVGRQTMIGSARVLMTDWLPAGSIKAPAANQATYVDHGIAGAWRYADAATKYTHIRMKMPNNWAVGTDIDFRFGWSSATTDPGDDSKQAVWQIEVLVTGEDDDTTAAAEATYSDTFTASGSANGMLLSTLTISNAILLATDFCLIIRIARLGGDGSDTLGDTAEFLGCCIQYIANSLGEAS